MSRKKSLSSKQQRRLQACERRYDRLRRKLVSLGYVSVGTITVSYLRCGQPTCRCRKNPKNRHGPYAYWTTKVKGRTVSRLLRPEELDLYASWISNRQSLDKIVDEMFEVSRNVAAILLNDQDAFIPGR